MRTHHINTAGLYDPAESAVTQFLQTDGLLIEENLCRAEADARRAPWRAMLA
jgi:hypothetical protein